MATVQDSRFPDEVKSILDATGVSSSSPWLEITEAPSRATEAAKQTCRRLAGLGCDAIQGYYLSKPLPPAELTALLAGWSDPSRHVAAS